MAAPKPLSSLRSDAQRNRLLLLEAAAEVLREQGLDASLDEISRRAGVGNATLYRHFPNREKLYEAVYLAQADAWSESFERSLAIEDGWAALVHHFEEACQFFATDQGLADLLTRGMPESPMLDDIRGSCQTVLRRLLERAQRQGAVRADLVPTDLMWILDSLQHVVSVSEPDFPDAWRRYLALNLRGLRTPGHDTELPASSVTPDTFHTLLSPRAPKQTPRRARALTSRQA
ncbi:MAG TPA: helix-turn-helix domain-containing protein [Pseudonocardia sp.]|jgi:AcrR family transcriptional regulator